MKTLYNYSFVFKGDEGIWVIDESPFLEMDEKSEIQKSDMAIEEFLRMR